LIRFNGPVFTRLLDDCPAISIPLKDHSVLNAKICEAEGTAKTDSPAAYHQC
jgi:hypothetical protein